MGSLEELADTAEALLILPRNTGRRIGMVGGGGGTSVAATDACAAVGLTVPPFDDALRNRLAEILPLAGTMMRNPVDVGVPLVPPDVFQKDAGDGRGGGERGHGHRDAAAILRAGRALPDAGATG